MRRKNAWTTYNKKQLDELEKLCKNYLKFLDKGKTERECVKQIVKQAEEKGYVNLADITKDKKHSRQVIKYIASAWTRQLPCSRSERRSLKRV